MGSEGGKVPGEPDFSRVLEDCLARLDTEGPAVVEEVCRAHPGLAERIRRALSRLGGLGLLDEAHRPGQDLPERLGGYRLRHLLGRGGMGVVYLADDEQLGRQVALKLIRPEHLYFPGARERFQREIEAAARLVHPGLVPIYTVGREGGIPYYAMEYVKGVTLRDLVFHLRGRPPAALVGADLLRGIEECLAAGEPSREGGRRDLFTGSLTQVAFRIALAVAEALAHAHACGVLHRDLKPSNVMVTPGGRVLLFDFGLAHIEGGTELTRSGAQIGSLPYMAPEQLRGDPGQVGARIDVYGLGVTLHELLTLAPPFAHESSEKVREMILTGGSRSIAGRNPAVPADARAVCLKAMATDPSRRYAQAADLARDLDNFLASRPVSARPPSPWYRLRCHARRHPARTTALAALALAGILGPVLFGIQEARTARIEREAAGRLRRALAEKERQYDRAEENLAQARRAIDKMLTRVSLDHLSRIPRMDPVRETLLEEAVELYRKLEPENPADLRHGWERARSLMLAAILRARLGREAEARRGLLEARSRLERIRQGGRKRPVILSDLARIHLELSRLDTKAGRMDDARSRVEAATALYTELNRRFPRHWPYREGLADSLFRMANFHLQRGRFEQAGQYLDRVGGILAEHPGPVDALVVFQAVRLLSLKGLSHQLQGDYAGARAAYGEAVARLDAYRASGEPLSGEMRFDFLGKSGDLHYNLSTLAQQAGELEPALAEARRCLVKRQELQAFAPERPRSRFRLAQAHSQLADLLGRRGPRAEATTHFRAALGVLESLCRSYPQESRYRRELGMTCGTLASFLEEKAGGELLARAQEIQEKLVMDYPREPRFRDDLGFTLFKRARLAADPTGRLDFATGAEKQFREMIRLAPRSAPRRKKFLAYILAEQAKALAALGRCTEALARLREAVRDQGLRPGLLAEEAFDPLRDMAGFKALQARR